MKLSDFFKNVFQKPTTGAQEVLGDWFDHLNLSGENVFESNEEEFQIHDRIKSGIERHIAIKRRRPVYRLRPLVKIAAIFIIVICIGALFVYTNKDKQNAIDVAVQPIIPGSRNAVINFGDGSSIRVNSLAQADDLKQKGIDLKIHENGKIVCAFTNSGSQNNSITIETPVGSEFQLILQDGTSVWMNAGSSISFLQNLNLGERRVEAKGEVYFEVTKLPNSKFFVHSGSQTIEVLGTQFRLKTDDEGATIKTTLIEGSIKLTNGTATKLLKPGQEASTKFGTSVIDISDESEPEKTVSWKDGYFNFSNTDFENATEQIEKWYNVKFVYENIPGCQFYGQISRTASIQDVLKMMEMVGNISFRIEGQKIIVNE